MNKREPGPNTTIALMVLGFLIGVIFIALGLALMFLPQGTPITINNLVKLHDQFPAFWLIDILPFVLGIVFGMIGNKQDALALARKQVDWLNHRHTSELKFVADKQTQQDQEYKELEKVISRGKQQWETTFDSVEDMIILTDQNGMVLRCNRATSDAFSTGFRQLIGKPIQDLFSDITNVGQGIGSAQKVEKKFPRLEGWYEVSNTSLMIEGQMGKIYIVRNVTDRKEALLNLDRQNQYYELLVKNCPIAIITLSQDDRIVASNPAFETLFGYRQRDTVGQDLDALISPPGMMEEARRLTDTVKTGNSVHLITQRKRQDGSLVDVEVFGIPVILWGKQIGALGLYNNVSDLVKVGKAPVPEQPVVEGSSGDKVKEATPEVSAVVENGVVEEETAARQTEPEGIEKTVMEEVKETTPEIPVEEEKTAEKVVKQSKRRKGR